VARDGAFTSPPAGGAGPSPADPSPEGGSGPQGEALWTLRAHARYGPPPVASAEGGPQAGEGLVAKRGAIRQARPNLLNGNEQCVEFLERSPAFPSMSS
jgi:hypothetical protein